MRNEIIIVCVKANFLEIVGGLVVKMTPPNVVVVTPFAVATQTAVIRYLRRERRMRGAL